MVEKRGYNFELGRERLVANKRTIMAFLGVPIPSPEVMGELPSFDSLVIAGKISKVDPNTKVSTRELNIWRGRAKITLMRFWNNLLDAKKPGHGAAKQMLEEASEINPDLSDIDNIRRILDHYQIPNKTESEEWKRRRAEAAKRTKGVVFEDPTSIPQPDTDPTRLERIDITAFENHLMELRSQRLKSGYNGNGFIGDPKTATYTESVSDKPTVEWGSQLTRRNY